MDARQCAMDASSTMFSLMQFDENKWEVTQGMLDDLKRELDALREIMTQMKFTGKEKHGSDEYYFIVTRIAVAVMVIYLSGKLDTIQVD